MIINEYHQCIIVYFPNLYKRISDIQINIPQIGSMEGSAYYIKQIYSVMSLSVINGLFVMKFSEIEYYKCIIYNNNFR